MARIPNREVSAAVSERMNFSTHNETLHAVSHTDGGYLVTTYNVPLAYWCPVSSQWYVNKFRYSRTTSRHLGHTLSGIAIKREPYTMVPENHLHKLVNQGYVRYVATLMADSARPDDAKELD